MADADLVQMRTIDLPGYAEWSRRRPAEYAAHLARLDATEIVVPRADLGTHTDAFFDKLLADLIADMGDGGE